MQAVIDISWSYLLCFSLLLAIPLAINSYFRLGLAKESAAAILRMSVQLTLVGIYLQFLFQLNSISLNLAWLLVMLLVGTSAIVGKARLPLKRLFIPVFTGLLLGLLPLLLILLVLLLRPEPVYHAQYLIPLAGMLLGNSMSGNIVALQRLFNAFTERQMEYEGALVLGASPYQASLPFLQSAMRQSLAPILASMATTGIVTLPGMMTGQILGGTDPVVAVKYQWLIMISIFVMLCVAIASTLLISVKTLICDTGKLQVSVRE
ncbi:ABC transporter permease [Corallincola luteus]|uniref:ABC transporter permease n=1 Tax=Corallincola luteus TaxID=1775177 RepID=A0ABY2AJA1_9GAMM|nr:ABC transporter permease [Corallincola luteus]TCI02858.1 ABC transporter permease [Corallincola luteus]